MPARRGPIGRNHGRRSDGARCGGCRDQRAERGTCEVVLVEDLQATAGAAWTQACKAGGRDGEEKAAIGTVQAHEQGTCQALRESLLPDGPSIDSQQGENAKWYWEKCSEKAAGIWITVG